MRGSIASAFLLLSLALSAFAAEPARKAEEPGTHVAMPFLMAPMSADGKLTGYAYISSKLIATSAPASLAIREKLAFIQDAFVRDVNAAAIGTAADPAKVDTAALAARLLADARRVVGAAKVESIVFTQIQYASLHPRPTTEDAVAPPERAPQAPVKPAG